MQEYTFTISYAYSGFMYLPIKLAEYLGYFPNYFNLENSGSDITSIKQLCHHNDENIHADLAICDPHFTMWHKYQNWDIESPFNNPIIIGKLIDRPPVWIINPSKKISPKIHQKEFKGQIEIIRTYKSGTTGYEYSKLFKNEVENGVEVKLEEVEFEDELLKPFQEREVMVTSNMLAKKEYQLTDSRHIIHYYGDKKEYKNTAFTGILTHRHTCINKFPEVLIFLSGIKKAINSIYNEEIEKITDIAYSLYKDQIEENKSLKNHDNEIHVKNIIQKSIKDLRVEKKVKELEYYPLHLGFTKETWEAFLEIRERLTQKKNINLPYNKFYYSIPSELLFDNNVKKISLSDRSETTGNNSDSHILSEPNIPPFFHIWFLPIAVLFGIVLVLNFIYSIPAEGWRKDAVQFVLILFYTFLVQHTYKQLSKDDDKFYMWLISGVLSIVIFFLSNFFNS